jgi:S1-C subfamily serine protease
VTTATGERAELKVPAAADSFREAMKKAGLKPVEAPDDLFQAKAQEPPKFIASGVVTYLHEQLCFEWPNRASPTQGQIHMVVEWQIYSVDQQQVVASITTTGHQYLNNDINSGGAGSINLLLTKVFAENARIFAADRAVRRALAERSDVPATTQAFLPVAQPTIGLAGSLAAPPRGMSSAADSVVVILVAGGHGSGFLASKDGYILTDAHVVEGASTVKIRWSDGVTAEAQVVRVDKGRDVALLKADPRGHAPLALRREMPDVGETVFAIGAPLDTNLQGTVMRGIVSARRVVDGYDLIQSDVNVNMGMSGGPLLDAQGRVVALTESKRLAQDSRSKELNLSINYFTPVADALKYLSLAPQ